MYMPTYMSCMAEYGPILVVCGKNRLVAPIHPLISPSIFSTSGPQVCAQVDAKIRSIPPSII